MPFIPQFFVVLVGMVPLSFAIAVALDRTLREVMRLLGRDRAQAAAPASAAGAMTVGAMTVGATAVETPPLADAAAVVAGPAVDPRQPVRSGAR
nr:hypothetical protein [Nocardia bovistercoris]